MSEAVAKAPAGAGREPVYDFARLTAIVAVVLIHCLAPLAGPEEAALGGPGPVFITSRLLRFSVPAFAMLTGALLWPKPFGGARSWGAFLRRRLSAVLAPFLAWSALYIVVGVTFGVIAMPSWRRLAAQLFLGTTWYHLYFIPIVIGIYLLAPLAVPLVRFRPWAAFAGALVLAFAVPALLGLVEVRPAEIEQLLVRIARYAPYAGAGAWYAADRDRWARVLAYAWLPALAAGMALRVAQSYGLLPTGGDGAVYLLDVIVNLLPSFALLGLAAAAVRLWPRFGGFVTAWAPFAFGLYLAHPLAILGAKGLAESLGAAWPLPWWAMVFVLWPAVTAGVLAAVRALARFGWLWWLTGVRAQRPSPSV